MTPEQAARLVVDVLTSADLQVDQVGDRGWMTVLAGEWKRTIPVLCEVGDRSLTIRSLLTGALDEGHAAVYAALLHRNDRARHVHFALDDDDDLVLVGRVPLAALDADVLGEALGEVLSSADGVFNRVLRTGFAAYLDHEQRWRRDRGLPPNPAASAE